jgi:DoxX-like family
MNMFKILLTRATGSVHLIFEHVQYLVQVELQPGGESRMAVAVRSGAMKAGTVTGFVESGTVASRGQWRVSDALIRSSIAMVWLYQGLWCKVLGYASRHEAVIAAAPFIGPAAARTAMVGIGMVECGMAVWVLSGRRMRWAAAAQTALLIGMNAAGLLWARNLLADPAGMILQNFAFVLLIWVAAENRKDTCTEASHAGDD